MQALSPLNGFLHALDGRHLDCCKCWKVVDSLSNHVSCVMTSVSRQSFHFSQGLKIDCVGLFNYWISNLDAITYIEYHSSSTIRSMRMLVKLLDHFILTDMNPDRTPIKIIKETVKSRD